MIASAREATRYIAGIERAEGQCRPSAGDPETARLAIEDARSVAQELASLIDRFEPMTQPARGEARGAAAARASTKNDRERQARLADL
jgi:hypothetical protein